MPAKRNGVFYVKRSFRGIGKIVRSLQTRNRARAVALEGALLSLHAQGRIELVRAFAEGELSIEEISEAYETGQIPALSQSLRNQTETLATAIECVLEHRRPDVKETTLDRYRCSLAHFEDYAGSAVTVREALTEEVLQGFKAHRLAQGAARETINNDLGAVSILVSHCLSQGWIDHRPKIRRYASRVRIRYLGTDHVGRYLDALRPAFRPLFSLLIGTGLRLGEAEALRVTDLRFAEDGTRALVRDSKTAAGVRSVYVPRWVTHELEKWIEERELGGPDRLFEFGRRTIQKEHERARSATGLSDYTIHDHRHTAAVHMARSGMPINLIQQQLGHANISQTMRYAVFNPDYADYGRYFQRIEQSLSVSGGHNLGYSRPTGEARDAEAAA